MRGGCKLFDICSCIGWLAPGALLAILLSDRHQQRIRLAKSPEKFVTSQNYVLKIRIFSLK